MILDDRLEFLDATALNHEGKRPKRVEIVVESSASSVRSSARTGSVDGDSRALRTKPANKPTRFIEESSVGCVGRPVPTHRDGKTLG